MADQQLSAPERVPSGIRHVNHDHRRGYVKIGNHLAQHRELSMAAIGLATHIQSLPTGAKVTIKALAGRFPEGEVRIAAALRELERHGYLARIQERLPSGRVVTSTISYNNPGARADATRDGRSRPGGPSRSPTLGRPLTGPRSPNRTRNPIRILNRSPHRKPRRNPNQSRRAWSWRRANSWPGCGCAIRGCCCPSATRYGWRPQLPSGWSAG